MRNPYIAALVGALACVSVEAFVLGAGDGKVGDWLIVCAVLTGPGALLLAIPFAYALEDQLDRGASRGRLLALGTLGGAPVGVINGMVVLLLLAGPSLFTGGAGSSTSPKGGDAVPALVAATFGGAALGLGCAWWISMPTNEGDA